VTTQRSVSPVFRREALEFQQYQRQWGEIVLLQPVSSKLLAWSLTAAVALVIVFLCTAQYARKDTAVGYLTPTAGTAKVFAPQQGVIKSVEVTEGQEVQEGQPLLRVATSQVADDGEDVNAALLGILTTQKLALSRQIAAEEQRTASERERLTASLSALVSEASRLNEQATMQDLRIQIGESLVAAASKLASKGVMSDLERKRREEAVLDDKQKLASLGQQAASLQERINEARYSLEQLPTVMASKLQPLRNDLASAEQRIAEINGHRAYVVRAPITGRVSLLQAHVGQAVDPQRLELEIVPAHSVLQAQLFIPARAAGFVRVGQRVRILYDAFPYQKFGTYGGRITEVSQTILTASDVSGPVALREPAYKVVAALDRSDIEMRDKKIPLRPDMLLKADIILDKRTLMSWLVEPLLSTRI
jgi:membrane fusion protein